MAKETKDAEFEESDEITEDPEEDLEEAQPEQGDGDY